MSNNESIKDTLDVIRRALEDKDDFTEKNENILIKEEIKSTTSFDVVESVYATLIAEKDAREKSLQVISEDIFTNLVIFFKN